MAPSGPIQPGMLDVNDVFGRSWEIYKSQLGICLAVVLVAQFVPAVVSWVVNGFGRVAAAASHAPELAPLIQFVTLIPIQLLRCFSSGAWLACC